MTNITHEQQPDNPKTVPCPLCNGEGHIPLFSSMNLEEKKSTAHHLKKQGCSIRQIATIMGYKSHKSVQDLLIKENG